MASDLQHVEDGPRTVTLADGKEYTLEPIGRDVLFGEFRNWIRERRRAEIAELPAAVQTELFDRHVRGGVPFDELIGMVLTVEGAEWLLWRSMQGHHAGIKRNEMPGLFNSVTQMIEIAETLIDLPETRDESPDPPKKAQVRKKRSR